MPRSTASGPRTARVVLRAMVACVAAAPASAASLTLRHQPPACFVADTFPTVQASFDAGAARVRVAFRPDAATLWHAVPAEAADGGFRAVLPRPRASARRIHYRFEAVDAQAGVAASDDFSAPVVADAAECPGTAAETVASATVLVDVPPGAPLVPPVPAGFDPVGAVSAAPHKASGGKRKVGVLTGVVVGSGAVVGGVLAAAGSESAPPPTQALPPSFTVRAVTPAAFGTVSFASTAFVAEVSVVLPRDLTVGEAWVAFYGSGRPPEQPCAVVTGAHGPIPAGNQITFQVRSPFLHAAPCATSVAARIYFRTLGGAQVYESGIGAGAALLDASIAYTFVP